LVGGPISVNIAICDDSAEDAKLLSEALCACDSSFNIVTYTDGQALIDDFLDSKCAIDILFLDIYIPGIDGIKLLI